MDNNFNFVESELISRVYGTGVIKPHQYIVIVIVKGKKVKKYFKTKKELNEYLKKNKKRVKRRKMKKPIQKQLIKQNDNKIDGVLKATDIRWVPLYQPPQPQPIIITNKQPSIQQQQPLWIESEKKQQPQQYAITYDQKIVNYITNLKAIKPDLTEDELNQWLVQLLKPIKTKPQSKPMESVNPNVTYPEEEEEQQSKIYETSHWYVPPTENISINPLPETSTTLWEEIKEQIPKQPNIEEPQFTSVPIMPTPGVSQEVALISKPSTELKTKPHWETLRKQKKQLREESFIERKKKNRLLNLSTNIKEFFEEDPILKKTIELPQNILNDVIEKKVFDYNENLQPTMNLST